MAKPGPILIIANATSGRGRGGKTAEAVAAGLSRKNVGSEIRYTKGSGDAERIAGGAVKGEGSSRYSYIVACGGDGTVQEVANAIASAGANGGTAIMGLAPAGRCNDFARALGISARVDDIVRILVDGTPERFDLGRVNGRYFCTVATAGIDAEVSRFVDTMRMPLKGTAAYIYGALRVLAAYRAPMMRIEAEGEVLDGKVLLASSANTASYGGAIPIAPDAHPRSGVLSLCLIRAVSRLKALALVPAVLRGRHGERPEVRFLSSRRFTLDAEEPLELWADGERIAVTPATIEVAPAAIDIVVTT